MVNVTKSLKIPVLGASSLGIAVLGYLGCHVVRWILNKCHHTAKIDAVVQQSVAANLSERVPPNNDPSDLESLSSLQPRLSENPHAVSPSYTKWELAQRLTGDRKVVKEALRAVFTGIFQELEIIEKTKFEDAFKERVWDRVSGDKLMALEKTFIRGFCEKILGLFNEEEASAMLEEHRTSGAVINEKYKTQLQEAFQLFQSSIIDSVVKKANSISEDWVPETVNAVRSEKLRDAVEVGDLDAVKEALKKGVNPNASSSLAQDVIHLACEKGNVDIVRALLDNGAELNGMSGKWNNTPLHRACVRGQKEVVAELIKRGALINIRNGHWETPLGDAITFKHFECCQLLIQAGAKVNETKPFNGGTPLNEACGTGSYEIVKLLLDSGADPNMMAPLYNAVPFPAILQLMLERGAKTDAINSRYSPIPSYPIHQAAGFAYEDSVSILLKAGADPTIKNGDKRTPVELARLGLNYLQTHPSKSEEEDAQRMQKFKKIIDLLE